MSHYDFIVIGAGVIGASVAHHLAALGAQSVLVIERGTIGAGTTSQSSGLLRTHYSVRQNVELARSSWWAFNNFAEYVGDDEASCGLVKCGYLICAPEGDKLDPLRASLAAQQDMDIEVQLLDKVEAHERLPIANFDDAALIGFEPEAGFADAYLVATGFARSARRRGVKMRNVISRRQRPEVAFDAPSARSARLVVAPAAPEDWPWFRIAGTRRCRGSQQSRCPEGILCCHATRCVPVQP